MEANLARGLLDALSTRRVRPLTREERDREESFVGQFRRLDEQISALLDSKEMSDKAKTTARELRKRRDSLRASFGRFEEELTAKYGVAAGEVHDLARIQAETPQDAALLAWVDVEGNSKALDPNGEHWACVVRHEGQPIWVRLAGTGEAHAWTDEDDRLALRLRTLLSSQPTAKSAEAQELVRRLYAQRLAPVEPHLSGVRQLIVLPAGWMAGMPVEVLTDKYTVSYAPSGTMYAWLVHTSSTHDDRPAGRRGRGRDGSMGPLLALGDPVFAQPGEASVRGSSFVPLPGTRREVELIARLCRHSDGDIESMILLGSDASEQRLDALATSGELSRFRRIHLATHGVMDNEVAMRSALILSQDQLPDSFEQVMADKEVFDGRLTADQIVRTWRLDADLVTLSACETALGKASGGEGFLGFAQALFVSGARSLVLSLWKVDDTATALLMQRFYENLLGQFEESRHLPGRAYGSGEAMPKGEALREAKLWLRNLTIDQLRQEIAELPAAERGTIRERLAAADVLSEHRPYAHPYYCASFILIGDPG